MFSEFFCKVPFEITLPFETLKSACLYNFFKNLQVISARMLTNFQNHQMPLVFCSSEKIRKKALKLCKFSRVSYYMTLACSCTVGVLVLKVDVLYFLSHSFRARLWIRVHFCSTHFKNTGVIYQHRGSTLKWTGHLFFLIFFFYGFPKLEWTWEHDYYLRFFNTCLKSFQICYSNSENWPVGISSRIFRLFEWGNFSTWLEFLPTAFIPKFFLSS